MPTPSGLPTKTDFQNATLDVAHLGRVVNSKDASGAPITTSTNRTGGVNKTLDALEAEFQHAVDSAASFTDTPSPTFTTNDGQTKRSVSGLISDALEAIRNAGGQPLGDGTWQAGQTFTAYNQFMVYNGIAYKPLTTTTLPYGPTGATPDLAFVGPFSDVTDADITIAQGEIIGGVVFPSSGDLAVGMTVPIDTTHLRVDGGVLYEMSPVASGVVTAIGGNVATIGGNEIDLASLNKLKKFSARAYGLSPDNNGLQNCKALQRLSRAVKRNNGGRVVFEFGTYRVGAQTFAGATGKGYSYKPEDMFRLNGVTGDLYFDFQACKFEWEDGLKFGSFDPVTGDPIVTTLPYYVNDSRADVTWGVVEVNYCQKVFATGSVEVDGRDTTRIIGGQWGDRGYQIADYGLRFVGNKIFHAVGAFYCHNVCLDGAYLAGMYGDDCYSKWDGLVSLYNSRQAISIGGGSNIHLNSVVLGYTGLGALNMGAAPGAGIDIEPEFFPLRGLRVTNFKIFPCVGAGIVGDDFNSNEVVFQDGSVANNINTPLYAKISNMTFERVKFYGMIEPCHAGVNPAQDNVGLDNVLAYPEFINCEFHSLMPDKSPGYKYPRVMNTVIAKIKNCKIFADIPLGNITPIVFADRSQVDGLDLTITGFVTEQDWALTYFRDCKGFKNFRLINKTETTADPAITARVEIDGSKRGVIENAYIEKTSNGFENVLWVNSYRSSGARAGFTQNVSATAQQEVNYEYPAEKRISLSPLGFFSPSFYGTQDFTSGGSAAPTTGFFRKGHVIWIKGPSAGGFAGWVTTTEGVAGSTAVFKRFGQIEA